ncbi:MAG: VCBS repeat-containing protein, partial [Proteobacteria bacterium]|nr:VCBS repeat-containing protein [Pseudomonadota bacterium]
DSLSYAWAILSTPAGSTASLSDATAARPAFTADIAGDYVLQLIVGDGTERSLADTVTVTTGNSAPTADAGPDQTITVPATIQLDGGASSDADSDPLTFFWSVASRPKGGNPSLSDPSAVNPTFPVTKAGTYIFQLIVNDGTLDGAPETVTVTTLNSRPVADAGPDQSVIRGNPAQLDGSASNDADNDPLTHRWALVSVPAGSAAALSDPAAVSPTLTTDLAGLYVAQLIVSDGALDADPDTVVVSATNTAPIADAGPDQVVIAGNIVQLDGSGSSDPDNDPLTFAWSLTTVPAGSTAVLSNPNIVNPTFTADLTGTYVAQLIVDDGFAPSAPDTVTITALQAGINFPPVLDPVGNQTVALGSTLNLTLTASDPNNDPLAFSATPLPLPDGASLNGVTGAFTFQPDATQVGVIDLTFTVSDGFLTDSEAISITVTGPEPGGVTAMTGRLLDANDFAAGGTETPIEGATVTVAGVSVTTDANGDFTLSGIASGEQIFDIDSSTVINAPAGVTYAGFREAIELIADVTNVVDRPFFLPRIDPASLEPVNAGVATSVVSPSLAITLDVPADTAMKDGQLFNCQNFPGECELSISTVPPDLAPVALPEELEPSLLISIQPVGVTFTSSVPITFPNNDNLEPLSEVDIYSLSSSTGNFIIVGTGLVSADGTEITTLTGGIQEATWHLTLPPVPPTDGTDNNSTNNSPDDCTECNGNSGTHVNTGNLTEDHTLASYRSLGRSRALRLVYNSTSADPQPIIVTETTIPLRSAVPDKISTRIRVAGVDQGARLFTSTSLPAPLSESIDETIHQAVQFDASAFTTGVYPYQLLVTNHFGAAAITGVQIDTLLVNNEAASPFGAGWTLAGLSRLHTQSGGLVLTEGDGSIKRFFPAPAGSGAFGAPSFFVPTAFPLAHAVDNFNSSVDTFPDLAVPEPFSGKVKVFLNDGAGGFPTIQEFVATAATGGVNMTAVASGDFNKDLASDIVTANQQSNTVTVLFGDGAGSFSAPLDLLGTTNPVSVGVADFDNDTNLDIAVVTIGFLNDKLAVFFGDGAGGFSAPATITVSDQSPTLFVGDVNDDGNADAVTAGSTANVVSVMVGDGMGGFASMDFPAGDIRFSVGRWGIAAANMNPLQDPFTDLVVANADTSQVSVLFNNGMGSFAARTAFPAGASPNSV